MRGTPVRAVLKIRRKGVVILPKRLREALGVKEGDEVVAEVVDDKIIMRPLKPKVVKIEPGFVDEIFMEELELERRKHRRLIGDEETGSRH